MSIDLEAPLVIAGAGKMGGALLEGLLARGLDTAKVIVQDPHLPPDVAAMLAKRGIRAEARIEGLDTPPSVILVAVKPQVMDQVFPALAKLAGPQTVVLSIAAGRTIAVSKLTCRKEQPSFAPCRTRPPPSGAASPCVSPTAP